MRPVSVVRCHGIKLAVVVLTVCLVAVSARIPCNNGQVVSTPSGDVCECWGAVTDMGILSNTFFGASCSNECRPYCNGRGMCSIDTPGVCTCDDPMHWEGAQCQTKTATGLPGEFCTATADCISGVCLYGVCNPATCSDGVQNQDEAGVDCGGTYCDPCDSGAECTVGSDCSSHICTDGKCIAATCSDGVANGDESDVDCGGDCAPCAAGATCNSGDDCATCACDAGSSTCVAHSQECGDMSECQLRRIMNPEGGASSCPLCAVYLTFLNAALREGDMTCPLRSVALLAHIKEGTGGLQSQLAASGVATTEGAVTVLSGATPAGGAIPLIPANIRAACAALPSLRAGFSSEFEACAAAATAPGGSGDVCACGSDAEIAAVAARPEYAFRTAVWWFAAGAAGSQGTACADLRLAADEGGGSPPAALPPTKADPGTGFRRTLPCGMAGGFGAGYNAAAAGRILATYEGALAMWDPAYPACDAPSTCAAGQHYAAPLTDTCAGRSCETCTTCPAAEFQVGGCVGGFDRRCAACKVCEDGLAVEAACTATTNTVCTQCSVCAVGTYETQACTSLQDRECAACSTCGADEWQAAPCGGTDDTQCVACLAPAASFPDCSTPLALSDADMVQLAGCANAGDAACVGLKVPFQAALELYNMSCPLRAAALAAQIRFATGFNASAFRVRLPAATGGDPVWMGGAIPLLPGNARAFCRDVGNGDVAALFDTEVGGGCAAAAASPADPCACGSDAEVASLLARHDLAFRSAAWWFARGSHAALGAPCDDLRGDADYGVGAFGLPAPSRDTPGLGFRKITSCILGFGVDTAAAAREALYVQAMRVWDAGYLRCPVPAHAWPSCSDGVRNGLEPGTDCGGTCADKCAAGQGCFVDADCAHSGPADPDRHMCDPGLLVCRKVSVEEQCSDGLRNGDELGVDCGGSCGATCPVGEQCTGPQDCLSGACKSGVCAECVYGDNVDGVCTCWGASPANGTLSTTYFGEDCSSKCRADRCYGRGMCSDSKADLCTCDEPLRFEGDHCEQSTCGHGYAVYENAATVICRCAPNWTGSKCDTPVSCIHGDWVGNTCNCEPGWSGVSCAIPVGFVQKCLHGVWDSTNFQCVCNTPWIGGKCERVWVEPIKDDDCFMGSRANASSPCVCDNFWSGAACNVSTCVYGNVQRPADAPQTCECIDTTWGGLGCDVSVRGDCMFSGAWDTAQAQCQCDFGSSGSNCQIREVAASGVAASGPGFSVMATSVDNADAQAGVRVVHAPTMCEVALTQPGDICFPFELAVMSPSPVEVTLTLDSDVGSALSLAQKGDLRMERRGSSAAAALGVDIGDQTKLGAPSGGCTPGVTSLNAGAGSVVATLCPGEFYYVLFNKATGDGSGGFGGISGSGLGNGISGQEVPDYWSAAPSSARPSVVVALAIALLAAVASYVAGQLE